MRGRHEEIEQLERSIVKELQMEPATAGGGLHRVRAMIKRIMENYHPCPPPEPDRFPVDDDVYDPDIDFSREEASGRYLDLHELFREYVNSVFGERIGYSAYIDVFSRPHEVIPLNLRLSKEGRYKQYLQKLLAYLIHFIERTEPLQDVDAILSRLATEFEEQWASNVNEVIIRLEEYTTVEELTMKVRPEKLKEALALLGLKTGGTPQQRAERLFLAKQHKHTAPPRLDKQQPISCRRHDHQEDAKEIALMEAKLKRLCDLLHETITQTKERVERKQGLTYKELQAEWEEQGADDDDQSSDRKPQQQNNNPLKLPMGWEAHTLLVV
ncbi:unnamed protein product [Cuscuta campestris]|uniref:SF3A3 domain-containing protein n=1 Tax=Cuscuta campestris TaxID=132261 RepID=A0A484MP70_9ASTE|nr:unnamed protein product [Cuscuta campestris]